MSPSFPSTVLTFSDRVVSPEPAGHPLQCDFTGSGLAQLVLLRPLASVLVWLRLAGPLPLALETLLVEEQCFPSGEAPHCVPAGRKVITGRVGFLPLLLLRWADPAWIRGLRSIPVEESLRLLIFTLIREIIRENL